MENLDEDSLREAASNGDYEIVLKLLNEKEINVNSRNKVNGWTALHWACKRGHGDVVQLLLAAGAEPLITNFQNETPATVCTNPAIAKLLTSKEDNANSQLYMNNYPKRTAINNMPTTMLPSVQEDALEDWLYKNENFLNRNLLLMWQSDPCVVIGRHQNPFIEANLSELEKQKIKLVRRNSGGGTVYHDNGNLNLSFFTEKDCYNRKHNLGIISRAVYKESGITLEINKREDLVINGFKVSGTAAKLGRPNAYHHCTLLVNANKTNLSKALKKCELNIETNATKSIRSEIINLSDVNPHVSIEKLQSFVAMEFMETPGLGNKNEEAISIPMGIKIIKPSETDYPGLTEIKKQLSSWEWVYGKTPEFNLKYSLDNIEVNMRVEHGVITAGAPTSFIGTKFTLNTLEELLNTKVPNAGVVIRIRVSGIGDPDFIEVEIPKWKLTYKNLLRICCEELQCSEDQVERIRKLPNIRLRNDADAQRLNTYDLLELVMKGLPGSDKPTNCYQSISTCKNQTILY